MSQLKARRYNKSKTRFELIDPIALEKLAKVYTRGAEKYHVYNEQGEIIDKGDDNWKKGMSWKDVIASVKRHIKQWEIGEDFDFELGTEHLANAAWGLFTLLNYKETHPKFDDRNKIFKKHNIWLDIDGVLADFNTAFANWFDLNGDDPKDWNDHRFRRNYKNIHNVEEFWLSIPKLVDLSEIPFTISGYCTTRSCSNEITDKWLEMNGFPQAEIINCKGIPKSTVLLEKQCTLFVDDHIENFIDVNSFGITCLLMDRSHNRRFTQYNGMRITHLNQLLPFL
jgi:uncharacterized HAD superfamily protein